MNIIGIDPSLISTALVIGNEKEFKIFNYCKEDNISTKTGLVTSSKTIVYLILI